MMIMIMIVATVTSFIDTLFIINIAVDTFCILITTYYISFSPRRRQSIIVTTYDGWFIFHQLGLGLFLVISENWTLAELNLLVSIPIPLQLRFVNSENYPEIVIDFVDLYWT